MGVVSSIASGLSPTSLSVSEPKHVHCEETHPRIDPGGSMVKEQHAAHAENSCTLLANVRWSVLLDQARCMRSTLGNIGADALTFLVLLELCKDFAQVPIDRRN
jgi:hypothetical protein